MIDQQKRKKFVIAVLVVVLVAFIFVVLNDTSAGAQPLITKAKTEEVQTILVHHGYHLKIDGIYGPKTMGAVKHWQKANRLYIDGIVGPVTLQSLRQSLDGPANPSLLPAKRLNPPIQPTGLNELPLAPEGLDSCAEMVFYMDQAGLPERFNDSGRHQRWTRSDGIGWRESKCDNTALNACCGGYWQNYIRSHLSSQSKYRDRIINECQVTSMDDIVGVEPLQKQRQACVTKVVYDISGLSPWD